MSPECQKDVSGKLLWTNDSPEEFYLLFTTFQLPLTTELLVTHSAEFPAQMSALHGASVQGARRGCAGIWGTDAVPCRAPLLLAVVRKKPHSAAQTGLLLKLIIPVLASELWVLIFLWSVASQAPRIEMLVSE